MKLRHIYIAAISLVLWFSSGSSVGYAAVQPQVTIRQSADFAFRFSLTSEEAVNAYEFVFAYPAETLAIDRIDTSRSLITIAPNEIQAHDGKISIAGGSSKPFAGSGGELFTLYVKPLATGVVDISLIRGVVYRADGTGAPLSVVADGAPVTVNAQSLARYDEVGSNSLPADADPPLIATPVIAENPLQDGARMLIIDAVDTNSGVGGFEVRSRSWVFWDDWRAAVNPYPLEGGAWAIQVMAFDSSGNKAVATVYEYPVLLKKIIVVVGSVIVCTVGLILLRRRKARSGVY